MVLARVFPSYPESVEALRSALGARFAGRLQRVARLDRGNRLVAAGRLELELLRDAPVAAFGTPTIPELFSARVACKRFQPPPFGVDLAGLCLRHD
jgi:hypothetical protein